MDRVSGYCWYGPFLRGAQQRTHHVIRIADSLNLCKYCGGLGVAVLKIDQPLFQWIDRIFPVVARPIGFKEVDEQLCNFRSAHGIYGNALQISFDGATKVRSAEHASCQHEGVAATLLAAAVEITGRPDLTVCDNGNRPGRRDGA